MRKSTSQKGLTAHGKQQTAISVVASATATRYGLSRGLLGLKYDRIDMSDSDSAATQPQMRSFFVSSKATELSTEVMTAEVRFAHSTNKAIWDYVRERV